MKLRLTIDRATNTIIFWRRFGVVRMDTLLPDTQDIVFTGELPHNFRHGNCDSFYHDSGTIKEWHDQNDDQQRCALLKTKSRSINKLYQRIHHARLRAADSIGNTEVFERALNEAQKWINGENPKIEDYPFLKLMAEAEKQTDFTMVAKTLMFRAREYDEFLLKTERLRLKWSRAVCESSTIENVQKTTQKFERSTLLPA